ncbi:DUF1217 domain-containing protein [Rhizobium sp. C1]|uniref:DUF1217 domain-containing protein n=1 Tax=Rhizobium sp. C1 TaxID=1349799 RepID=UPI001E4DBE77|nr:DUF1217 domain-containing protein [Rhizobium sp. C1]MCD2179706.1 DUF1217 domain-containing protein [Rhizobium sp. C1]
MVSTFLSYDLIARDMTKSLNRVASEGQTKRETDYFNANISKVTTVDGFMGDYRLYSYAMKAFGLDDMTYAKAFMKKVLSSDLTDPQSFANRLSDQKYRDFANAFQFGKSTAAAQTSAQKDSTVQAYKDQIVQEEAAVTTDTAYYKQAIGSVKTVDGFMNNSKLYSYAMQSVGLDPDTYSRDFIKKVLTSDVNDSNSYVNKLPTDTDARYMLKQKALALRNAFNFNTAGGLDSGTSAQSASQIDKITQNYILNVPSHVTPAAAQLNNSYLSDQMGNVTKVSDITGNDRLFSLVKTALGLPSSMMGSTFQNIVTSDTSTNNNYAYQQGGSAWTAVAKMFNFDTNGNVKAGDKAMSSDNLKALQNRYLGNYSKEDDANDAAIYTYYGAHVGQVNKVDDLINNTALYNFALRSVGLSAQDEMPSKIKMVLESDVNDPKSYVNQLSDKRYVALAKEYNFGKDGKAVAPRLAQSQAEISLMAQNYVKMQTRYGNTAAKTQATDDMNYYTKTIQGVDTVDGLLSDSKLVKVMVGSYGFDPAKVTKDFLKKVFSSDLSDPKSFANTQPDQRWAQMAGAFNFDNNTGKISSTPQAGAMDRRARIATVDNYYQQTLETEAGDDNPGTRLALYFQRMAPTITSAYDILADQALLQFFKTSNNLPDGFSKLPIDTQADKVKTLMNLKDLSDPDKVKTMVKRFTALYDVQNGGTSGGASALSILSSSGSGASLSANTLFTLSQLKLG